METVFDQSKVPESRGRWKPGASKAECENHSGAAWLRGRTRGAVGFCRRFPAVLTGRPGRIFRVKEAHMMVWSNRW